MTRTVFLIALAACSSESTLTSLSFTADPDGATLEDDGLVVEVPPGALAEAVTITATPSFQSPDGVMARSPVWTFEPDGLVFLTPITVHMAHEQAPGRLTMFWTDPDGVFGAIPSTVADGWAVALVEHFSAGVVGDDEDPCDDDDLTPEDDDDTDADDDDDTDADDDDAEDDDDDDDDDDGDDDDGDDDDDVEDDDDDDDDDDGDDDDGDDTDEDDGDDTDEDDADDTDEDDGDDTDEDDGDDTADDD